MFPSEHYDPDGKTTYFSFANDPDPIGSAVYNFYVTRKDQAEALYHHNKANGLECSKPRGRPRKVVSLPSVPGVTTEPIDVELLSVASMLLRDGHHRILPLPALL